MSEELLRQSKVLQSKKQWKLALEAMDEYQQKNDAPYPASLYAMYARCLRILGNTTKASKMLDQGLSYHPESERIFREYHILYDSLGDWKSATEAAKNLIRIDPKNPDHHFRLGRSYSFLNNHKKSKKAYLMALQHSHGIPWQELVQKIHSRITDTPAEVRSKYVFIDGKNNLGAFIHELQGRKYFTKISKFKNSIAGPSREELFYKELCSEFPQLQELSPRLIDSEFIDKISYLTIEMVDHRASEDLPLQEVIRRSRQISTVRYSDLDQKYPAPDYAYQFLKGRAISVTHLFTQIHQEKYNKKLFKAIQLILQQNKYPHQVAPLMKRLETLVMDNRLFEGIHPEEHYSLLHGDFAHQNILHKKNGDASVIDWTSFTVGPNFLDLARYFTSLLLPYSTIKEEYLQKVELSPIERIFFLYALIVFYFQKMGRRAFETQLSVFILPALEDLEQMVITYLYGTESNDMKSHDLQIQQLEQRLAIVEEEKKQLNRQIQEMSQSKSWKLTAPLRIFTSRKK